MSYSNLTDYVKLSPNHSGKRQHRIDTITIHCTAGTGDIYGLGSWFSRTTTQASSNYGIDSEGKVGCYVEEENRSWCSSNSANDNRAITIEVANTVASYPYPISDKAYNKLIQLCADICVRNGIDKLVWSDSKDDRINHKNGCNMTVHRDYANKSCPGEYIYQRLGQIASDVNKIIEKASPSASEQFSPVTNTVVAQFHNGDYRRAWTVTARDGLNMRYGAGTNYDIILTIPYGDIVRCYGYFNKDKNNAKWFLIKYNNKTGYVHSAYLK